MYNIKDEQIIKTICSSFMLLIYCENLSYHDTSDDISSLVYSEFPPDTYSNSERGFAIIQFTIYLQ